MNGFRKRVVVYGLLNCPDGPQLLVFEHRDIPDAGVQVPAGGIEADESVEDAARRELREETGVVAASVTVIGQVREMHPNGYWCENTYVYVALIGTHPSVWEHTVSAGDADAGLVFTCYFLPLNQASGTLHESQRSHLTVLERAASAT